MDWVEKDPEIKAVIDLVDSGFFSINEPDIFNALRASIFGGANDRYYLMADLRMYHDVHESAMMLYKTSPAEWNRKAVINIASSAKFSSDRTIKEYADDIWNIRPCKVKRSSGDTVLEDARKVQK